MQASRRSAMGVTSIAYQVFKMQNYRFVAIEIPGEGVQSFWRAASMKNEVAHFLRKAGNMLRVVTIL
jgi:hypothetical protein